MFVLSAQRPNETDYELWWLAVFVASGVLGLLWLKMGAPAACPFHEITGLPCPTCGGTRCLRSLLEGHVRTALGWNPLVFCGVIAVAVFAVYAAVVTAFRLPRLRIGSISKPQLDLLRIGLVIVLAANWIYLVFRLSRAG